MSKQRTLKNEVRATGVGVHSGEKVLLTLKPAPVDHGIVFHRMTDNGVVEIPAHARHVGETRLCTMLVNGEHRIGTVEHLLSALAGLGVDNAIIEVSASEVPIMDGSSGPFVFLIQSAGIEEQAALKKFIRIKRPIEVREGDKVARLEPYEGFRVDFTIDYDHPIIQRASQESRFEFSTSAYVKEVSRARTFGFMSDFEWLRSNQLGLGASLDNTIALDEFRVLNEDGLRYEDEFVRHKILDALGDLYLMGHPIVGAFVGHKSGHSMNNLLNQALLAEPDAWEIVTYEPSESEAPISYGDLQLAPQTA